jgi:hypothetical protein
MINWPNKTQRRVLRELAEVTIADGGYFHEERLDMPVEEVRRHLQAAGRSRDGGGVPRKLITTGSRREA